MHSRVGATGFTVLICVLAATVLSQCSGASTSPTNQATGTSASPVGAAVGAAPNPCGNTLSPLTSLTPQVPSDFTSGNPSQIQADCFAWQEFIALNWAAAPNACGQPDQSVQPAQFGTPNDTSPLVWETYKNKTEVFRPKAEPPTAWCAAQDAPDALAAALDASTIPPTSEFGHKVFAQSDKFGEEASLELTDFIEAGTNSWLTAQNGYITMYEVRLNETEFNYIANNQLYDADVQQSFVLSPGLLVPTGTIEIKAAWIELDDPSLWPSFKTSQAVVFYPSAPTTPVTATMGLVGLHIIQKTPFGQQFVWATFEHVNNAPSSTEPSQMKDWYSYYNKNCDPNTDHYKCVPNTRPTPNVDPYNAPVQVMRSQPIDDNANTVNQYVWSLIRQSNPNSVFLNYQLVNTLWPNSNTIVQPGTCAGKGFMPTGDPQPPPGTLIVANTTLETYFQEQKMCLDCHRQATVAKNPSPSTCTAGYASDYSFLFGSAQSKQ